MPFSQQVKCDLEANSHHRGHGALLAALLFSPSLRSVILFRASARLVRGGPFSRLFSKLFWLRNIHRYGCHLAPQAKVGDGLALPHPVGVVVGEGCVIGAGVTLYQSVTLGRRSAHRKGYPTLGNGVTVYAGAVIVGAVKIGDGARIGANSLVLTDVPPGAVVSVQPADIIDQG